MRKNNSYLTTIWVSILTQIYVFLVLFTVFAIDLETFISKNWKNILFYQKFVHLGENTFPYCSRIIAVYVYVSVFIKSSPSVSQYSKRNKPGSNSKTTDKHAVDCSKAVCLGVKCSM